MQAQRKTEKSPTRIGADEYALGQRLAGAGEHEMAVKKFGAAIAALQLGSPSRAAASELSARLAAAEGEAERLRQRLEGVRGQYQARVEAAAAAREAADAAMRERERCWAAWANADTLHLCVDSVPLGLRLFDGVGGSAVAHARASTQELYAQ
mgnify:CR=1 FL=1